MTDEYVKALVAANRHLGSSVQKAIQAIGDYVRVMEQSGKGTSDEDNGTAYVPQVREGDSGLPEA